MKTALSVERRSTLNGARVPTTIYELRDANDEVRTFTIPDRRAMVVPTEFEVETRDEDGKPVAVRGLGVVFDSLSEDLGGFVEQVDRGAVRKVLSHDPDVVISVNHNFDNILGRTGAGTAEVVEVPRGVDYRAVLNEDDPMAMAWAARIKRGDISGSSFMFTVARDRWEEREDGSVLRTILEIDQLFEMGPVATPAYKQTDATAGRSADLPADDAAEAPEGVEDESELREMAGDDLSDVGTEERVAALREQQARSKRLLTLAQRGH